MSGCELPVLLARLGNADLDELKSSAKAATLAERKSLQRFIDLFDKHNKEITKEITSAVKNNTEFNPDISQHEIELLILQNAFEAMKAGIEVTQKKNAERIKFSINYKLPIPRKYAELMKWWDKTRKNKAPPAMQKQAAEIKKKYLAKCQQVYKKYSGLFRSGDSFNQEDVAMDIRRIGDTTISRAKIIVTTETTRYYNQVRKEIYDQSEDITHYLYVAIRDFRTTEWCNDRNGLVYEKNSPITKRETPPIHYQCRSEMLPLSPFNPVHKKLIDDKSLQRKNHKPKPLLPGWNE